MRRMFRRGRRRGFTQTVPPILQEANMAFEKGEFGRAAEMYERIAQTAEGRGGPRAPMFHLQAGRARTYAGQASLGIPSLKRGLELLAQLKQFSRLNLAGERVVNELNERGLVQEASEINVWLKSVLPNTSSFNPQMQRPVLPTHCPSCGGPLRPDEVEWLDKITAECIYCGSPVR